MVNKPPVEVTASDVLEFIAVQRRPRGDGKVVRLADGEAGLSPRTIKRRVATVSGFLGYLSIIGAVSANPVPRGLSTRRQGRRSGLPLVRTPRTLPKVLDPGEVNALLGALRRCRDRAMIEAMVLGALRRCEVLGLRLEDLRPAERRVFIADGKGGHQRLCRSRGGSSPASPATSMASAHRKRPSTRYSSCSKAPHVVDRCRWTGSMRSCGPPAPERAWRTPPAMNCATPA